MRTITLGALSFTDTDTVRFRKMLIDGWDGASGSTLTLVQKIASPGGWLGVQNPQRTPRGPITISGMILAATVADMQATIDAINDGSSLTPTQLTVSDEAGTRWAMVYQQAPPTFTPFPTALVKQFSVQLVAPDPRKFADDLSTSTGLPGGTGGLTAPFSAPFTVNSTITSGSCSLTNPGNANGPVKLRIDGPITGPQVTHVGSGLALTFASSLVLRSGEWIDVDMEAQTVLANGTASRAGWVTQRGWSSFEPGPNLWALTAVSGSGLLTVTATPAWN